MRKVDLLIIGVILVIGSFLFIKDSDNNIDNQKRFVEIYVRNELVLTTDLNENTDIKLLMTFENNSYQDYKKIGDINPKELNEYDIIHIYNNGIQVIDADCRSRLVVRQGFIERTNAPLICVPRQLLIIIRSSSFDNIEILV